MNSTTAKTNITLAMNAGDLIVAAIFHADEIALIDIPASFAAFQSLVAAKLPDYTITWDATPLQGEPTDVLDRINAQIGVTLTPQQADDALQAVEFTSCYEDYWRPACDQATFDAMLNEAQCRQMAGVIEETLRDRL